MNQQCKVCGEQAAGYHFGAFTCEGCKSFFGRSHNNQSTAFECKNGGSCEITKKNRTTCKACRLKKCRAVGMSKSGSRYGRRSNWFKIHCLLQEHQNKQAAMNIAERAPALSALEEYMSQAPRSVSSPESPWSDVSAEIPERRMQPSNSGFHAMGPLFGHHPEQPDLVSPLGFSFNMPLLTPSALLQQNFTSYNLFSQTQIGQRPFFPLKQEETMTSGVYEKFGNVRDGLKLSIGLQEMRKNDAQQVKKANNNDSLVNRNNVRGQKVVEPNRFFYEKPLAGQSSRDCSPISNASSSDVEYPMKDYPMQDIPLDLSMKTGMLGQNRLGRTSVSDTSFIEGIKSYSNFKRKRMAMGQSYRN